VFLHKYNAKYKMDKRLLPEVIRYFESNYHWPGNVRELENVVERLVVSSRYESIAQDDEVLADYFGGQGEDRSEALCRTMNLKQARELMERELIQSAIQTYGSTRNAAKVLGMDHSTVARKAKKYGINTG
ncbi:MAG TPA: TyrR/PhhR family helix-turn-helix DNA-binding protein, partial [Verrucomicrobiae bacterium]|nr:TyrR/PhhR family helix-turn-helix DNA-binding protein [Verrucomicrobiae bacterium]